MGKRTEAGINKEIQAISAAIIRLQDQRNDLYIELDKITSEES